MHNDTEVEHACSLYQLQPAAAIRCSEDNTAVVLESCPLGVNGKIVSAGWKSPF